MNSMPSNDPSDVKPWRTGRPSPNDDQATPRDFFAMLDREFRFVLDVACTEKNRKCERFITKEQDAFKTDWTRAAGGMGPGWAAWCNPPYSDLERWVDLCIDRAYKMTVVMLVPADPSTKWWKAARMAGAEDVALYCWHARPRYPELVAVWKALDLLDHQQIIWVKPSITHGYSFWPYQHEPCLFGWRKGHKPPHDGDWSATSSTVWNVDWEGAKRVTGNEHPTQKPIELFRRPMRKHTKPEAICYEPFAGSGSQIIAGEVEGRRVFAMELSPVFVDVVVRRFIKTTGKPVELLGAGGELKSYLDVARERGVPVDATKLVRE